MQIFQIIWTALTTENELLSNIIILPINFIESTINTLIFTTLLNIDVSKKQKIRYIIFISILLYISGIFIPNPYKLKILDAEYTQKILEKNEIKKPKVGQIISTHYKSRTIIVMCKNGKSLKMVGTNLYGFINKPFTKIFIKNIQPKSL